MPTVPPEASYKALRALSLPEASATVGTLYLVAVPIGNLEDITLRALRVLKTADRIACEDTRSTGKLLSLLGIERRPLMAVHDHNEGERIDSILAALRAGEDIALVSDAGTPTISDPGFKLTRAAIAADVVVVPIPGVSAVITAVCASGLPTDDFRFVGFLPKKQMARRQRMAELATAAETLVLYASPHRLAAVLEDAQDVFGGDRPAVIARELTKRFEEFRRGTLTELVTDPGVIRGEIVLLIGGAPPAEAPSADDLEAIIQALLDEGMSASRAAKHAAMQTGVRKAEAYRVAVALSDAP